MDNFFSGAKTNHYSIFPVDKIVDNYVDKMWITFLSTVWADLSTYLSTEKGQVIHRLTNLSEGGKVKSHGEACV